MRDTTFAKDAIVDHIHDAMHAMFRDDSIDNVLCRPYDAIKLAKAVCGRASMKASEASINRICKLALNARKAGHLKRDRV